MTLEEFKTLVEQTRNGCDVIYIHGSRVKQCGGIISLTVRMSWAEWVSGRYSFTERIMLDEERPVHELQAVWFHELGHREYVRSVLFSKFDNADSETFAYVFGIRELTARRFVKALRCFFHQTSELCKRNRHNEPDHVAAIERAMVSPEWAAGLALVNETTTTSDTAA